MNVRRNRRKIRTPVACRHKRSVREWQMERNILGILKRITLLLAVCGRDPQRSFEYLKRSSSAAIYASFMQDCSLEASVLRDSNISGKISSTARWIPKNGMSRIINCSRCRSCAIHQGNAPSILVAGWSTFAYSSKVAVLAAKKWSFRGLFARNK